jgi:hypothetical protein
MAANNLPIYSAAPHIDSGANNNAGTVIGPSANTAQDGTGANMYQIFQAGTNGSYIQKVRFKPVVSPAATVARIFINSNTVGSWTGGTTNTATNTWLLDELTLPIVTLSQTVQSNVIESNLNFALPGLYRLAVSFGTSCGGAGTGYSVVVIAGDY